MKEVWLQNNTITPDEIRSLAAANCPVGIGYIRVSSQRQADDGNGLDVQKSFIRDKCLEMFGDDCILIWIADAGVSGRRGLWRPGRHRNNCRLGLTAACELMAADCVQFLMVYKCSRLARSMRAWIEVRRDFLDKYAVRFLTICEDYDTSRQSDKMLIDVLMLFAEMEVNNYSQQITDAHRKRRADGYAAMPAFGWRWQQFRAIKPGNRRNIERHPEYWLVVRRIFEMCIEGMAPLEIGKELMRLKIPTATGKTKWIPRDVRNILLKPIHRGFVVGANNELITGRNYEERIIDEAEFFHVERVLEAHKPGPRCSYLTEEELACRTLIRCGICGAAVSSRGLGNDNRNRSKFTCAGRQEGQKHSFFSVRTVDVTSRISQTIAGLASNQTFLSAATKSIMHDAEKEMEQLRKDEKRLFRALANKEILFTSQAKHALTERNTRRLEGARDVYRQEVATLQAELTIIQDRLQEISNQQKYIAPATEAFNKLTELWDRMDWEHRCELMGCLLESVEIEPTSTHVVLRIKLVFCESVSHNIYVHHKTCKSTGLDGATPAQLTLAYYLLQGYELSEIAAMVQQHCGTLYSNRGALLKRAGTSSIDEMLRMVAPVVQERESDLLLGIRGLPDRCKPISEREANVINLICDRVPRKMIMDKLCISRQDYRTVTTRIYNLWQVRNIKALRSEGIKRGFGCLGAGREIIVRGE